MTIVIEILFLIGIFTILVFFGAAKSNKELEGILNTHVDFKYIKIEKSKIFDNHITVRNLKNEIIAIVYDGEIDIDFACNAISQNEYSEIVYVQNDFKRVWRQL